MAAVSAVLYLALRGKSYLKARLSGGKTLVRIILISEEDKEESPEETPEPVKSRLSKTITKRTILLLLCLAMVSPAIGVNARHVSQQVISWTQYYSNPAGTYQTTILTVKTQRAIPSTTFSVWILNETSLQAHNIGKRMNSSDLLVWVNGVQLQQLNPDEYSVEYPAMSVGTVTNNESFNVTIGFSSQITPNTDYALHAFIGPG